MPVILTPQPDHEDRLDKCREAITPALNTFIAQAVRAGWVKDTVCMAISEFADSAMMTSSELDDIICAEIENSGHVSQ